MKKIYLIMLAVLFYCPCIFAQITETFETETNGATSFSEGGITFNITSQQSYFFIQGTFPNTGWNGTAKDNRYIDNSGNTSSSNGVQFTISTANNKPIALKSMWLYIATSGLNLSPIGTLTLTGKLAGNTVYTVSQSNPFNPDASVNNGFTLINLANFGGQNNSNKIIDQYVISTDMGIGYMSLDAMKFECAPVSFTNNTKTDVSCYGGNNGTATVVPTAGGTFTIGQPSAALANTKTSSNILCYGQASGSAGVTASGGTPPYTYAWSNGQNTAAITGLAPGTYNVTITDAKGCTVTDSATITQPAATLGATTAQTNVLCYGNSTGSAGVTVSGGTSAYTYLWNNGATTASISNLASGTYNVTITDSKGCTLTKSFTITQPSAALAATTTQANVLCNGNSTGSAGVTVSGGTAGYSYVWNTGATTASITNRPSGNYSVTITDANGCTLSKNFTITQPSALAAATSQTNISCYGNNTGSAGVTVSGGTAGYSYVWNTGATTASISNLAPGNYSVTITDANNCTLSKNFSITQPAATLAATIAQTDVLCYGSNSGSAGVTVSGGTSGYSYVWNTGATTASISNLAPGNYSVTITDANNCTLTKNFTITQPSAALSATTTQTNVQCYGSGTSAAGVTVAGGTAPYTYLWSSGQNTASINNIANGNYTVTVTDANNCTVTKSFTISGPVAALMATVSKTDVQCQNSATGSAGVTVSGGTAPYTYVWLSGQDTAAVTGLSGGSYSVTITDANGCTVSENIVISEPSAPLGGTVTGTQPLCYGNANGTATVAVTGGVEPYTYAWSNGGLTDTITGLVAGNYSVTVTDANGCVFTNGLQLYQPWALTIDEMYVSNSICSGSASGSIIMTVNGGTQPYTYAWSNGATTSTVTNLAPGDYTVVVTDAKGCFVTETRTITETAISVSATYTTVNVGCYGAADGQVTITSSGGVPPYDYYIPSSGMYTSNPVITGFAAGDYSIMVRDAYNCSTTINFTITQPDAPLTATTTQTDAACYTAGVATVYPTGGTPPYTYLWNNGGGTEASATSISTTTYTVTVTDAVNCSIQKTVTINDVGECGTSTTWNGTSWSNGAPLCEAYAVIFEGDFNSEDYGNIIACSVTVNSGNVVINSGNKVAVMNAVSVLGGSLTFESEAYLIQYTTTQNVGQITFKRNSSALYKYDYTLWSSPVMGGQTLKQFSPQTLDARFYVYNTALGAFSNYLSGSGIFGGNPNQVPFVAGKGYLVRMPDGLPADVTSVFTGTFQGTPNNGDVNIALNTTGDGYNAVGNPYPSPLRLYTFVMDNQQNLANGTVYFWRKTNGSTENAYTTISLAGSVEGCEGCGGGGEGGGEGNQAYTFAIKPGQGFLVEAKPTATNLSFTNFMRWDNANFGQFFKTTNDEPALPNSKLWLNITNSANVFGQTAIAYMEGTTLDLDYGYDGTLFNDGVAAVYTTAQDAKLSIQARDVFNVADEVALGYKITAGGNYAISLDHFTGLFSQGQDIYLKDALLGVMHDLKNEGSYSFATEVGTFDNRFTVVYQTQATNGLESFSPESILAYKNANAIFINSGTAIMQSVEVFDIHGRLLYANNDVDASDAKVTGLVIQEQVLIIQVTTAQGYKVTKKIIY
ncbi:MAG: T9SS sorting signal type C domain-containing protein [Bacteroidota bacterium]